MLPEWQGNGIGRALLYRLLEPRRERTAVLSTPTGATPATGLYRSSGFVDLITGFRFPGTVDQEFTIMAAQLPLRLGGAHEPVVDLAGRHRTVERDEVDARSAPSARSRSHSGGVACSIPSAAHRLGVVGDAVRTLPPACGGNGAPDNCSERAIVLNFVTGMISGMMGTSQPAGRGPGPAAAGSPRLRRTSG